MTLKIWTLLALSLSFCTTKVDVDNNNSNNKSQTDSITSGQPNKLLGIWTDGNSENATFSIDNDSIYYVDHFKSYKYTVDADSIRINYDDFIYTGSVSYFGDTLVLTSDDDTDKFWPFKN